MPTLVAFEGWSDAGGAATAALRHVRDSWESTLVASIESEEFFDFTKRRPTIHRHTVDARTNTPTGDAARNDSGRDGDGDGDGSGDGEWQIDWPDTEIWECRSPAGRYARCVIGAEPHLRWRTFAEGIWSAITPLVPEGKIGPVVALGSVSARVAHTQRSLVFGDSSDESALTSLGVNASAYDGPTCILGVLQQLFSARGVAINSLWATVPTYVPSIECPKASLALLASVAPTFGFDIDLEPIALRSLAYEDQVDELIADDPDMAEFVSRLENGTAAGDDQRLLKHLTGEHSIAHFRDSTISLISDVEHYLRDK